MEFVQHERKSNKAYFRTLDLQLNGNQINLAERPTSKDQVTIRKKLARSLRPCTLRRPMSATPSFGYRESHRSKRIPPWSRPQSAGSSGLRRNKLAAKFSHSTLNDPDYCPEFGTTYTLSSSQLLQSLMGSCSINEGLDSDNTPIPSPQPSLGGTIRAAVQLEPGLTAKPPLPPTPTPTPYQKLEGLTDDIVALKFQQWFPDAILESEIIRQTTVSERRDEIDQSDGGSLTDVGDLSDRENVEKPSTSISTFVKKTRTPKGNYEDGKRSTVTFKDRKIDDDNDESTAGNKSLMIVLKEPDPYGCDLVTEEFVSETNIRCLAPDYLNTLKRSSFSKSKNEKCLSLSDLNDANPTSGDIRSHSVSVFSDSEASKEEEHNIKSGLFETSRNSYPDAELNKNDELRVKKSSKHNSDPRNDLITPENMKTPASKLRFTSTPIDNERNKYSPNSDFIPKDEACSLVTGKVDDLESLNIKKTDYSHGDSSFDKRHQNYDLSPPTRLRSEEEIYHDHLNTLRSLVSTEDQNCGNSDKNDKDRLGGSKYKSHDINKTKDEEKDVHFIDGIKPLVHTSESLQTCETLKHADKSLDKWSKYHTSPEKTICTIKDKKDIAYSPKMSSKYPSVENMTKDCSRKTNKPVKEICRAASVPPYPNSKSAVSLSKHNQSKDNHPQSHNSKRKLKRSMSYDASPLSEISEKDSGVSSYEDIVTMIKVLEREDLESPVVKYKTSPTPPIDNFIPEQSSSAKAILSFLDEVEKGTKAAVEMGRQPPTAVDNNPLSTTEQSVSSRVGSLLNTNPAELAQQVMSLTLQLEDSAARCKALEARYTQSVEILRQHKAESDEADRRHQKFIDQLLKEKRQLAVQYETAMREIEGKHETAIKVIEERHKVELKKAQEKFTAAEKIRRDKWIDTKTKKIKELTVRGLEPELERMSVSHQEELAELRRAHQRQLTEMEAVWARRISAVREQEASERQTAVQHEREAARHRLEQELGELEKSYQEQRRRLMEEVRQEKELLQRQGDRAIAEKQTELARQLDEAKQKLQNKLAEYEKQHQEELTKLKEALEAEKEAWLVRQRGSLEEKEALLREELKRERDRHIELVIRRLESEAAAKELSIENKIKRLKESYDAEVNDLDSTMKELRTRLKETRADLQRSEDSNTALKAQLNQAQIEMAPLRQTIEKLHKELSEAKQQNESKIAELQRETNEIKQSFQEKVNKIHNDKEKQLQEVYTRVKEAISKKEEVLTVVTKQRDLALEQCNHLEKMLETKRNHALKL